MNDTGTPRPEKPLFDRKRVDAMKKVIAVTEGGADACRAMLKADLYDAGMAGDVPAQLQLSELLRLLDFAASEAAS